MSINLIIAMNKMISAVKKMGLDAYRVTEVPCALVG